MNRRFGDQTKWMKLSEIGRYAAARELTQVTNRAESSLTLSAPFACKEFTLALTVPKSEVVAGVKLVRDDDSKATAPLKRVDQSKQWQSATWTTDEDKRLVVCFDLPKGTSRLEWDA